MKEISKEGDIVVIDESRKYKNSGIKPYKALVIWNGFNGQPLVTPLDHWNPGWNSYSSIIEVVDHVDLSTLLGRRGEEMANQQYHAVIIGVLFDEEYNFEDILVHGIAHSKKEAFAIQQEEMMRLYEDYRDENGEGYPVKFTESRSTYDDVICILQYKHGYEHLYCKFTDENGNECDGVVKQEDHHE